MTGIASAARRIRAALTLPLAAAAIFTGAKSFRANPVLGSSALNRHGLHVMRRRLAARLGAQRRRRLQHLVSAADRAEFDRNGFIVKHGFLAPDCFAAFRADILRLEMPAREAVIGDTLTRLIALDGPTLARMPTVRDVLRGERYLALLHYVGSFRRQPSLYVQTVFSQHAPEAEPDIQSYYHVDTFHPTVKAWLFLDDVAAEAAPFTYVPGSHRVTRRRLAWERRVSIGARRSTDKLTSEGSFRISEAEITRIGYGKPVKLPVAANTLIVADTSGIHRRSVTRTAASRVSIWAYSRSNPFLPWTGGDIVALPVLKDHAQRIYWAISDGVRDMRGKRREWRWVGTRSPLTPARMPFEDGEEVRVVVPSMPAA